MARELVAAETLVEQLATLDAGWTGDTHALRRVIEFADFPAAVTFIDRKAVEAERLDHHPDIDLRWRTVHVTLSTHSSGGVTDLDLALAREVDAIVRTLPVI